jgi:hypothetical protein
MEIDISSAVTRQGDPGGFGNEDGQRAVDLAQATFVIDRHDAQPVAEREREEIQQPAPELPIDAEQVQSTRVETNAKRLDE